MEAETGTTFGQLLRRYRKVAGLTQEALAERALLSAFTISALERGANQSPRSDTLSLLADALALDQAERAALQAAARPRVAIPPVPSVPLFAEPLVGRERELALLERHLAGEGPPVLLLAGEPGIGKTRLLRAAVLQAQARGWSVLEGGCQRRGAYEPYAPILGALQRRLSGRTPAQLGAELAGCAWLVRLLPELAAGPIEPLPALTLPPDQERRLMVGAAARFLKNVAGPTGALLCLDDLQWAGPDALDFLTALVRAATGPLRVIGAYRDTEVRDEDPLGTLLADLAHAGLATHHTVAPLAPDEAEQLLTTLLDAGAAPDRAAVAQAARRAGGLPFFLVSYARGLRAGVVDAVPWDAAQGIRQRVAALPAEAQALLSVAAVIGREVEHPLLAAVAGRPESDLLGAIDALRAAQLVRETDGGFAFRHDLIREVVEDGLGAARRALLHRQIAAALEGQEGVSPVERLAFHYSLGGSWERALHYLVRAGDKAATAHANQDALGFFAQALTICERIGDAALPTMLTVAQKQGDLHMLIQHPQEAIGDYGRMAEAARRLGDRRQEGLALAQRGCAEEASHMFETAEATLRAALTIGGEGYDDVRQRATGLLVHTITMAGRKVDAALLLQDADERAQQLGDHAMEQTLNPLVGLFAVWDGRFRDALTSTRFTEGILHTLRPADRCSDLWGMSLTWGGMGEYQKALDLLHECMALAEHIGEVWARRRTYNTLGWLYGELQDHARALDWNRRGIEAAMEQFAPESNPECEHNARLNLGDTLLALGRLKEAEEQFRIVERVARNPQPRDRYMLWRYAQHLYHSYGELWLARGETTAALAYADECLALAEANESRKNIIKGRRLRGEALLVEKRLVEAEREIDTALLLARQVGNPCQLWKTLVAHGDLHSAQGREREAQADYQEALDVIDYVASGLSDAALRQTFLSSDHVRHMQHLAGRPDGTPAGPAHSA